VLSTQLLFTEVRNERDGQHWHTFSTCNTNGLVYRNRKFHSLFYQKTENDLLLLLSASIMSYISLDKLFPTAYRYGYGHTVIIGMILGIIVMALSLLLF